MKSKLNVLILDNEQICIDNLKRNLNAFDYVNVVGELIDSVDYVKFLQGNEVDLIFLDIELVGNNGFEIAEYTKKYFPDKMIIFLTGYENFAIKGYEYEPIDFLSKPINIVRLEKALAHAKKQKFDSEKKKETRIGIHVDGGYKIIVINEILYIEKVGRKIYIVCQNGEKYIAKDSLRKLEIIFDEYNFFRSHQSFLVPIEKIKGISLDELKSTYLIEMYDYKEKLPLSRDKYQELKNILAEKGVRFF